MEKMLFTINGRGHPKRIATEATIKIGDVFTKTQTMTVLAK
jgi:hypothetical protein